MNKNKPFGQLQSIEQKSALNSLNAAPKSIMVATNRVSSTLNVNTDDGYDDGGNSSESVEDKLATFESISKLKLNNIAVNNCGRQKPCKEGEISEDEKKENIETSNNNNLKLLINFDDEANKHEHSIKQMNERQFYDVDDLQELF